MSVARLSCRLVLLAIGLFAATPTARAGPITLDFSEPGVGPFDPNFFADRGVVFQPGLSVGFILGDEALVSSAFFGEPPEFSQSISGSFLTDDVGFISIAVAPSSQYLSNFSIAALDQKHLYYRRNWCNVEQPELDGPPLYHG
jgi:hypothetical protein